MLTFDEYCKLAASYTDYVRSQAEAQPSPAQEEAEPSPAQEEAQPAQPVTTDKMDEVISLLKAMQTPAPTTIVKPETVEDVVAKIIGGR